MPDGNAPEPGSGRTRAQENEWPALLVKREALLSAGVDLDRRIPLLGSLRGSTITERQSADRRERTREARRAATDMREQIAKAPEWEGFLYSRHYRWIKLDRPSTETNPAPGYRQDPGSQNFGERYPVVSDYTSKAAIFDLVDWRKLGAKPRDEIAYAASWLGVSGGFQRVDPFWSRRRREAERQQHKDHLARDRDGRALVQPMPLETLLLDYPPEHHEIVRFVHEIVRQYCAPPTGKRLASWPDLLPRERRHEAYLVYRTCTPEPRGGKGHKSIPTLVDEILQRGFREIGSPYRVEGPRVADRIAARWAARVVRQSAGRWPEQATRPTADPWSHGYWSSEVIIAPRQRDLLVANLRRELGVENSSEDET